MKRDKMHLIAVGLLFVESLAGVVWGIQRGFSSLFAKEVLRITSVYNKLNLSLHFCALSSSYQGEQEPTGGARARST